MGRLGFLLAALALTSAPLMASEVAIELATHTGVISGTLTMPPGGVKAPVVLMIAGSGPTDRDGNAPVAAGRNDSLKRLAAALSEHGMASVRYDKRGVAASQAAARSESDLRFEDYVQDAVSWISKLSADSRFTGVSVLGHSEGSLIGLLASQRSHVLAFVSVAGPAERASLLLRRQLKARLPPELATRNEEILRSLEAGRTVDDIPLPLMALYRPSVQPYLMSWFRYSPADELTKLRAPCLIVQGSTDIQVGVKDAQALRAANTSCVLKVVAGMNHVMKSVPPEMPKQIASYGDPSLPIDPELVRVLLEFLNSAKDAGMVGAPRKL
jgi:pimeloyl-ACP methyl ester carboxylesterase